MFAVRTKSGTVYTIDEDNMRSMRASSVPLHMTFPLSEDYISNDWQDIKFWRVQVRQTETGPADSLYIEYRDGSYSLSTEILSVQNLTPVG
jgi:hypothetical protein